MKLKVRSKTDSFRRGGMAFTKEPQEIEVDQKTCDILKAEPMLVVEQVKVEEKAEEQPQPETAKGAKKGKGK